MNGALLLRYFDRTSLMMLDQQLTCPCHHQSQTFCQMLSCRHFLLTLLHSFLIGKAPSFTISSLGRHLPSLSPDWEGIFLHYLLIGKAPSFTVSSLGRHLPSLSPVWEDIFLHYLLIRKAPSFTVFSLGRHLPS